jgi:hypothetical protein
LSGVESCFNSAKILINEKDFSNINSNNNDTKDIASIINDGIKDAQKSIVDDIGKSTEYFPKDDWQSEPAKKGIIG